MSGSNSIRDISTIASMGGKAAAKSMTAEQRRERALKANASRKCMKNTIKATHSGILKIGEAKISCAVLEDGRRVITETSMHELLGRSRTGRKNKKEGRGGLPTFISANNLKPFINNVLTAGANTSTFLSPKFGKAYGYEATIIPEICRIYMDAEDAGVLTENQLPTVQRCKSILTALAKVGITALIDESCGYQEDRDRTELQKLFNKFISQELQPWTKRFPDEFFENIKRLYGLQHLKGNPSFCGHIINGLIYDEIAPEIKEELQKRNPITEKGHRKHRHHQMLTDDVGHPALTKQIVKVNSIMSVADNKEEFDRLWEKQKCIY